jgi:hypothetical protein
MKPFSILMSDFTEVILIDADVVFLQNPDLLFDHPSYKSTGMISFRSLRAHLIGSLFFTDRTLPIDVSTNGRVIQTWLSHLMTNVSKKVTEMRIWNNLSRHQMDSGVFVLVSVYEIASDS